MNKYIKKLIERDELIDVLCSSLSELERDFYIRNQTFANVCYMGLGLYNIASTANCLSQYKPTICGLRIITVDNDRYHLNVGREERSFDAVAKLYIETR